MDFTNSFSVRAPLQQVWGFLLDAHQVTPCVPGAEITEEISETQLRGRVKIKLGAVQVVYRGELEIVADEAARTITLNGKGTELRGGGGARGSATVTLAEQVDGLTHVTVQSHVDVTGRVAQFGRGIMQDVANRLINEFAQCLEQKLQQHTPPVEESERDITTISAVQGHTDLHAPMSPSPPLGDPTAAGASRQTTVPASSERQIELLPLVVAVARGRLAAGLRRLAQLVEPK